MAKCYPQIASISVEIESVDPLSLLHHRVDPDQPHFYFEKPLQSMAIAATGSVVSCHASGNQRFSQIQDFVEVCKDNLVTIATSKQAQIEPRFFCTFTFFDQSHLANSESSSTIPSASVFLPQWQVIRQQNLYFLTINLLIHSQIDLARLTEEVWLQFQTSQPNGYHIFHIPNDIRRQLQRWIIKDTYDFKARVTAALKNIQQQHIGKVVLAHAIDVESVLPFHWVHSLDHLRQLHPDCHIFSVSGGSGKSFIGASPERLISIGDRHLITDALAGSAPRGQTPGDDANFAHHLMSSSKERHEHQVVVDFMRHRLSHLGLEPQFASVPSLLQLSNIQHLHTPIRADIPATLHPLEILAELHPTPAVAGIPRDQACQYICRYEPFERSLYAAPLGWVDTQGNAEFIVGIRSALLEGCRARLYAGAGIVAGSNPERELAEVKLKLQALLQALV